MRNRTLAPAAALFAALTLPPAASRAAPIVPANVPADAHYVVHVDWDALRATPLGALVDKRLAKDATYGPKLSKFELATGMRFAIDLHGVTIYGKKLGWDLATTVINARMSQAQFMLAMQFTGSFSSVSYGNYEIDKWDDDNRAMYGAFHGESTLIMGRSIDNVKAALNTMDGKAQGLAATDTLVAGAKQRTLAYIGVADPQSLTVGNAKPNPMDAMVNSGWLTANEPAAGGGLRRRTNGAAPDVVLHASATASSADAAQQFLAASKDLQATFERAGTSDTATATAKFVSDAVHTMRLSQSGNDVLADVTIPLGAVQQYADRYAAEKREAGEK